MKQAKIYYMPRQDKTNFASIKCCAHCKNHYVILWLREADNWNDFGYRHCPFCGMAFDETTGAAMV